MHLNLLLKEKELKKNKNERRLILTGYISKHSKEQGEIYRIYTYFKTNIHIVMYPTLVQVLGIFVIICLEFNF